MVAGLQNRVSTTSNVHAHAQKQNNRTERQNDSQRHTCGISTRQRRQRQRWERASRKQLLREQAQGQGRGLPPRHPGLLGEAPSVRRGPGVRGSCRPQVPGSQRRAPGSQRRAPGSQELAQTRVEHSPQREVPVSTLAARNSQRQARNPQREAPVSRLAARSSQREPRSSQREPRGERTHHRASGSTAAARSLRAAPVSTAAPVDSRHWVLAAGTLVVGRSLPVAAPARTELAGRQQAAGNKTTQDRHVNNCSAHNGEGKAANEKCYHLRHELTVGSTRG